MKKKTIITVLIIFSLLGLSALYLYFENTKLQVSNYTIVNHNISVDFNNYKIAQISDFHNTKHNILINEIIKEIKRQKPNIIVLTGDLIDSSKPDTDAAINFIKSINSIAPIYFVSGNHEASISGYSRIKEKLKENKVVILDNKTEVLKINESQINLIGIDDPRMSNENVLSDSEIIKEELENAKYNENRYSILLTHRPELFNTYVENN